MSKSFGQTKIPFEQQQTTIQITPYEDSASVYTCMPFIAKRLKKMHEQHPQLVTIQKQTEHGMFFTVPKKWVKIRVPNSVSMTEEERNKRAEKMRQIATNRFKKDKEDNEQET